ncbi:Nlrc3 [Symbiodinium sp. CCMP2456]|nr:Nlrc3 [Symbiodinium sp. CCMP2456]
MTIVEILEVSRSIIEIDLASANFGDAAVQALAGALKLNKTLTKLGLADNEITDAGLRALADHVKSNETLVRICLARSCISDTGMEIFATALKLNHTVADLDLQHQAFLERVVHRRRVHHKSGGYLDFDWSSHSESEDEVVIHRHRSLGVAGIRAVSDMLMTNVALMSLNLDGNHVEDTGAAAIAEALRVNGTVTHLSLAENDLGDAGAVALAKALEVNTSVTHVSLKGNSIGDEGAEALANALRANTTLTVELLAVKLDSCGRRNSDSEVSQRKLDPEDEILLLCSDGVWEFVAPLEAVKLVGDYAPEEAMQAANALAKESWDRWIEEEGGAVVDDITVVLVYLK